MIEAVAGKAIEGLVTKVGVEVAKSVIDQILPDPPEETLEGVEVTETEFSNAAESIDEGNSIVDVEPDLDGVDMSDVADEGDVGIEENDVFDIAPDVADIDTENVSAIDNGGDTNVFDGIIDKGMEVLGDVANHAIETAGEVAKDAITNTIENFIKK